MDNNIRYGIGLDCGIASVGWAVMLLNDKDEPFKIHKLGSRIFDAAEVPKTGASLAAPRREARSARRRIRRHKLRNQTIRQKIIIESGLMTENELNKLFCHKLSDIYELRTRALDEILSNEEFARVLLHLAQRRGFKSNRKNESSGDDGKLLKAVKENVELMENKSYRTVGEMFFKDEKYKTHKRNKSTDYTSTVSRKDVELEVKKIFAAQREFGNSFATKELEEKYKEIVFAQRAFDEGPGGNSKYGGNLIEKMLGKCTFEPDEIRSPKSCFTFECFNLLQNINKIKIISENGSKRPLNENERQTLKKLAFKKASLSYADIRKSLGLSQSESFNSISYGTIVKKAEKDENGKIKKVISLDSSEVESKTKFNYLKAYHEIRKVLDKISKNYIENLSTEHKDYIGYAFNVYKQDKKITEYLTEKGVDTNIIEILIEKLPSFSGAGRLSVKAMEKILPYLKNGEIYSDAVEHAGYNFKSHSNDKKTLRINVNNIPELENIVNPVVKRAVSQTIKVVNAITNEMGCPPVYLNIELARELSKTKQERNALKKMMDEGYAKNEKAKAEIKQHFPNYSPKGIDIIKYKLWYDQGGVSVYSKDNIIELNRLFEPGYVDVDHIIPYSICFNDSYANKVLVKSSENREKGNRLPLQWLKGEKANAFKVHINNLTLSYQKKQYLLKETITEDDRNAWKERNLNDTRYISRVLYNLFNDNLLFSDFCDEIKKRHVVSVNGAATAYMRKRWGINKIRADGDLHHAVDAAVIACFTQGLVNKVSRYSKYNECKYSGENQEIVIDEWGEVIDKFPFPYDGFRYELDARISDNPSKLISDFIQSGKIENYTLNEAVSIKTPFVSRMQKHKNTGAAHKDTIRSGKKEGYTISKVELTKLKLSQDKDGNDIIVSGTGEYYNKEDDKLLYNALLKRLKEFDGNGEKAFPSGENFYKPTSDGKNGPQVKKVKIIEKASLTVPVLKNNGEFTGIAANGSMIRTDVFYCDGNKDKKLKGYYCVPIYVSDTKKDKLPNKACCNGGYEKWKEMDEEDFIFSIYPNDLIKITSQKDIPMKIKTKGSSLDKEITFKEALLYYTGLDIASGTISFITNDASYEGRKAINSLSKLEKYTVDILGNYHSVKKEKRQTFSKNK